MNLTSQSPLSSPIQKRTRSSSSVSAYNSSISSRGYLPTIQDSITQNDVISEERINSSISTRSLRPTRSNSSLSTSTRSSNRSYAASTTTFGSNNVPIHQQPVSPENRVYQQESGFGYASGGL
ncbi:hypothetical protein RhiirA5_351893 [Rhizophagus irregularis]|nr:hypothetical protein RhiirA5_351893 [Rhizophagus irregularis]PKC60689.1 hypothetical protein RhiirA1_425623 [Rhizophagus irregularis]PKY20490.1 hypothetical protein RhiirB3_408351 [Rhizophagus irregularis]PKY43356.1 hypothetical protein RhiirA4_398628 [Rhizophagus irregularis]